jgi:predicted RNA-binding protein with PUA-like domain
VGVVDIVSAPFPDPTDPAWLAVTCVAKSALTHPVTLTAIKADVDLSDMALVTHSRLSVQPVKPQAWARILDMGSTGI